VPGRWKGNALWLENRPHVGETWDRRCHQDNGGLTQNVKALLGLAAGKASLCWTPSRSFTPNQVSREHAMSISDPIFVVHGTALSA